MTTPRRPNPRITRFYGRYLDNGSSAAFIASVSKFYTLPTLHRMAADSGRDARRAAVLALGYLGDSSSIPYLGDALHDMDRAVRVLAEDGCRQVWRRGSSVEQFHQLERGVRLYHACDYASCLYLFGELVDRNPDFSEAWYRRALVHEQVGMLVDAIEDHQQALEVNPYHFLAAVGMAQCYLKLDDSSTAVSCLHWALRIHPGLECARVHLRRLERDLGERLDH